MTSVHKNKPFNRVSKVHYLSVHLINTKSANLIRKSGKIQGNYQQNRENRNFH